MSKIKTVIAFTNFRGLWLFAKQIKTVNIEVNRQQAILTCECTEGELKQLHRFNGEVIYSETSDLSAPVMQQKTGEVN